MHNGFRVVNPCPHGGKQPYQLEYNALAYKSIVSTRFQNYLSQYLTFLSVSVRVFHTCVIQLSCFVTSWDPLTYQIIFFKFAYTKIHFLNYRVLSFHRFIVSLINHNRIIQNSFTALKESPHFSY